MGNGGSNPVAQMAAKNKATEVADSAKDGFQTLTGGRSEKERERDQKQKDRTQEFEKKKKEREERKKKLAAQMDAHRDSRG